MKCNVLFLTICTLYHHSVGAIRISITSNFHHLPVVNSFQIFSYRNFEIHNTFSVFVVTSFCDGTAELISSTCPPSQLGHPHSSLNIYEKNILRLHIWVRSCGICLSVPGSFHLTSCLPGWLMLSQKTRFHPCYGWRIFSVQVLKAILVSFSHSSVDRQDGFQTLAVMKNAAINMVVQIVSPFLCINTESWDYWVMLILCWTMWRF
jgi:hypothetical protein